MMDKIKTFGLITITLPCISIGFSTACAIKADGDRAATSVNASNLKPARMRADDALEQGEVVFSSQPVEAPEPGSLGGRVDELHAWVTDELKHQDGTRSWGFARTTDGGLTWLELRPAEPKTVDWLSYSFYKVEFVSPTRGWLSGNDSTWQTDDGGNKWRQIFAASFDDVRFADGQNGWMNITDRVGQQSYVTKNGGQSWEPCGQKRVYGQQPVSKGISYFLTPDMAWALTSRAERKDSRVTVMGVAMSNDGGCSWSQVWTDHHSDSKYYDIYFLNQREGWLGGQSILLHTSDGGKSWAEIPRPNAQTNVLHVHFRTSEEGWISGGYPSMPEADTGLYRTTNGGRSWRHLTDNEVVDGFDENGNRAEVPRDWRAGKLLQLMYAAKRKRTNK